MRVNVVKGRSYRDWCDALAYSLYLVNKGRIGSRAEREYIDAERAARSYQRLASSILEYKFDEEDGEDDEIVQSKSENTSDKAKYGINANDDDEENAAESLLDDS